MGWRLEKNKEEKEFYLGKKSKAKPSETKSFVEKRLHNFFFFFFIHFEIKYLFIWVVREVCKPNILSEI